MASLDGTGLSLYVAVSPMSEVRLRTFPKILLDGDRRLDRFPPVDAAGGDTTHPGGIVVGWREWVSLPALGIGRIKAKIDTGAKTSALHADSIEHFLRDGANWVRFDVIGEGENVPWHEAPVVGQRQVRSSNGRAELRTVILTRLVLAGHFWEAEVSLTNRGSMELPMLIGREALAGRMLVDSACSWLWGRPVSLRTRRLQSATAKAGDRPGDYP
ncbi:Uncharacterized conserved protein [Faunimonas pinastri]|uniref:Uncharacterized conserved protein n=1 Tax=Faunimonas pinastri TaxID=1855383 RepID=A0A1H9FVA6_9HYPH|nr:ATP-dependent zinc protease [Faunimonas pinastri]SEQ41845.1 Uncharacterized conserved protein [Faunimonas pinastri]